MADRAKNLAGFAIVFAGFVFGQISPLAAADRRWFSTAVSRMVALVTLDAAEASSSAEAPRDKPYTSKVTKEDNTITLRGSIPSESDLKLLQGVVAATLPGANLVNNSRIIPTVPDRDTWLAGMTFALRHLAKLESGVAVLKNNAISIEGITKPDDNFAAVQQTLTDEVPQGLKLQHSGVRPAVVRPFVWLAQMRAGTVNLSGHVPDEFGQFLVNYAKSLFQSNVDNGMASARGAPEGWIGAAKLSLEMLNLLQQGQVLLSDRVIKLNGVFSSPGMGATLKSYSERLPKGFRLETNILDPVLRTPAVHTNHNAGLDAPVRSTN